MPDLAPDRLFSAKLDQMSTGVGLRTPHEQDIFSQKPDIGFLEIHSENYFAGTSSRRLLEVLRADYPISMHGVGLSLGRADELDSKHIENIYALAQVLEPIFISEHLSWSGLGETFAPDLLPLPFTKETLDIVAAHIDHCQTVLKRPILIENPSGYLRFAQNDFTEAEFLVELVNRTGCGLLLDVNNIAVSAHNLGYDARTYIDALPRQGYVFEIHLAGYQENPLEDGQTIRIDTHGKTVWDDVWRLYEYALAHFGDVATLVEWDSDIPPLELLLGEAQKANAYRRRQYDSLVSVSHAS